MLQKLSGTEFCSAAHRKTYFEQHQQLIAGRLERSAALIRSAVAAATIPAVREFLGFDVPAGLPHAGSQPAAPVPILHLNPMRLPCIPAMPPPMRSAGLAAPKPDLPWPRYNAGCRTVPHIDPEYGLEHLEQAARALASWNPFLHTA